MKNGIKKGSIRRTTNPGEGAALARVIGTPKSEYKKACSMGLSYSAAGVPDYEAIEEVFGLFPEMLSKQPYARSCVER